MESIKIELTTNPEKQGPAYLQIDYIRVGPVLRRGAALAFNSLLSARVSALTDVTPCFPIRNTLYFALLPQYLNSAVTVSNNLGVHSLMGFFRNGFYRIDQSDLIQHNAIAIGDSVYQFAKIKRLCNIRYLCHALNDDWRPLRNLKRAGFVEHVRTWSNYVLYEIL